MRAGFARIKKRAFRIRMNLTEAKRSGVIWLTAACAALLALHSTIISAGAPAFRHDWVWPLDAQQLRQGVLMDLLLWQPTALGSPNPMPVNHPVLWFWYLASYVLAPAMVLKITLWGVLTAYAAGVGLCAYRASKAQPVLCAASAAVAVLGPPIFNKFVAGHINYLIALACFPWVLYFAFSKRTWGIVAMGAVAALSVLQIQIFIIVELIVFGAAVTAVFRGKTAASIAAVVLSLSLFAPVFLVIVHGAAIETSFTSMKTIAHYELNNSAPFPDAIVGLGYFTHYAERAYAAVPLGWLAMRLLWIVPVLAAIACIRRRDVLTVGLCAAFTALILLVLGLRGPLAGALLTAFNSSLLFSVLRELYHFEGLAWTILCILAAMGMAALWAPIARCAAILALAAAAAAWIPQNYASQLFPTQAPLSATGALSDVSRFPGSWAALLLPAQTPIGQGRTSGADPYAYPIDGHPSLNGYRLFGIAQAAAQFGDEPTSGAWRYRHLVGVGAVVARPQLHTDVSALYEPPSHVPPWIRTRLKRAARNDAVHAQGVQIVPTCFLCAYDSIAPIREVEDWRAGNAFVLARDFYPNNSNDPDLIPRPQLMYPTPSQDADPSVTWVAKSNWDFLDRRIAMIQTGVMTWSSSPLPIPKVSNGELLVRVLLLHGTLMTGDRRLDVPAGRAAWVKIPCRTCALHVRNGLAVVSMFAHVQSYTPKVLRAADAAINERTLAYDWRSTSGQGMVSAQTHWIVLKQRFSPLFHLDVTSGRVIRHIHVDGYANGWEIEGNGPLYVHVFYEGQRICAVVQWLSLSLFAAAVVVLAIVRLRFRASTT